MYAVGVSYSVEGSIIGEFYPAAAVMASSSAGRMRDAGVVGSGRLGCPSASGEAFFTTRPWLAYFSAASACLGASASRRAPVSCIALAALNFASAACCCFIILRRFTGLEGILPEAAALHLSCAVVGFGGLGDVC